MFADSLILTLTVSMFVVHAILARMFWKLNGTLSLAFGLATYFFILTLHTGWLLLTEYVPWLADRYIRVYGARGSLTLAGLFLLVWMLGLRRRRVYTMRCPECKRSIEKRAPMDPWRCVCGWRS